MGLRPPIDTVEGIANKAVVFPESPEASLHHLSIGMIAYSKVCRSGWVERIRAINSSVVDYHTGVAS